MSERPRRIGPRAARHRESKVVNMLAPTASPGEAKWHDKVAVASLVLSFRGKRGSIRMAYFEYNPTTPLYYYVPIEAFEGIIRSKKLWLTDITASNDPRELRLGQEIFAAALNALSERDVPGLSKQGTAGFLADLMRFQRSSICYAVCFGLAGDELPMWREYAGGGTGLSIAFRPTSVNAIPGRLQLVRYTDDRTAETFREAAIAAAIGMGAPRTIDRVLAAAEAFAAITALKHKSWSYEREVRMIFNQRIEKPDPREQITKMVSLTPGGTVVEWKEPLVRGSRGREAKYFEFGFGRSARPGIDHRRAIDHVVLGPNCAIGDIEATALLQAEGFENFQVRHSDCQIR